MSPLSVVSDATPTESNRVFHYTSAATAIKRIMPRGQFLFGPMAEVNDPRESQQRYAHLTGATPGAAGDREFERLSAAVDVALRRWVRVACFVRDFTLPPTATDESVGSGWNHPALWAHYGDRHRGVCLAFDRERLVAAARSAFADEGDVIAGPVSYFSSWTQLVPLSVDHDAITDTTMTRALDEAIRANLDELFFAKHRDWRHEAEFRVLVLGRPLSTEFVSIVDSLTDIYVGPQIAPRAADTLLELLSSYPGVRAHAFHGLDGNMFLHDFTRPNGA